MNIMNFINPYLGKCDFDLWTDQIKGQNLDPDPTC